MVKTLIVLMLAFVSSFSLAFKGMRIIDTPDGRGSLVTSVTPDTKECFFLIDEMKEILNKYDSLPVAPWEIYGYNYSIDTKYIKGIKSNPMFIFLPDNLKDKDDPSFNYSKSPKFDYDSRLLEGCKVVLSVYKATLMFKNKRGRERIENGIKIDFYFKKGTEELYARVTNIECVVIRTTIFEGRIKDNNNTLTSK